MSDRLKHNLATVLAAFRDKIANDGILDPSCVFWSLNPDRLAETAPPADRFVGVTFDGFQQPPESVTTDAETDEIIVAEGEVVAAVYLNINVDHVGRDDVLLADRDRGGTRLIEQVVRCFSNVDVCVAGDDPVLNYPPTFLGVRSKGAVGKLKQLDRFDIRFQVGFDWNLR